MSIILFPTLFRNQPVNPLPPVRVSTPYFSLYFLERISYSASFSLHLTLSLSDQSSTPLTQTTKLKELVLTKEKKKKKREKMERIALVKKRDKDFFDKKIMTKL